MQIEILKCIGIEISGKIWDPRIGHWLIEPDEVSTRSNDMLLCKCIRGTR